MTTLERGLFRKRARVFWVATFLLTMPVGQALACYTVNMFNNTGYDVTAMWGAQGCLEVHHGETEICETKLIKPQQMGSYDYNWGTTAPTVWGNVGDTEGYVNIGFNLSASGGNFAVGYTIVEHGTPACDTAYTVVWSDHQLDEATAAADSWDREGSLDTPVSAGYIYGTDSNANNKCLQAASTSFSNGNNVHVWDHCIKDPDQKNRFWRYDESTGYIQNAFDESYCLHKKSSGYTKGDNIHMWKCDEGSNENKQWEYNKNGQHMIRSKANNSFCIVRAGPSVGDNIHVWSCYNTDQNARWKITDGDNG